MTSSGSTYNPREQTASRLRVAVVIATLGRPRILTETLRRIIKNQTYKLDQIIVSCVGAGDAGEAATWTDVCVITGKPGLAAQRNNALDALYFNIDIVVFFDDDFIPAANWVESVVRVFKDRPEIACVTGSVLADGIKEPGISFDEADRLVNEVAPAYSARVKEPFSPYGCNMAFRRSAIGAVRFDERLVLYGWLEDRDFGAAIAASGGRIVKSLDTCGVHMGVKSGRIAGFKLGYSQIINPLYMMRKGTMAPAEALSQVGRNLVSNLVLSVFPEPFVDRRGRLKGNIRGLLDVCLGRLEPERVLLLRSRQD